MRRMALPPKRGAGAGKARSSSPPAHPAGQGQRGRHRVADRTRTPGGVARRRPQNQPADRRGTVLEPENRRDPPAQHFPQDGRHDARRPRARRRTHRTNAEPATNICPLGILVSWPDSAADARNRKLRKSGDRLRVLGPGGAPILPAGSEGYSGRSWHQLVAMSPQTAGYITLVFRMYGIYIVGFGLLAVTIAATAFRRGDRWAWWALLAGNTIAFVSAMTYDRIVGAIGPFEWSEYLGLAVIYGSLAVTFPALTGARAVRSGSDSIAKSSG